MATLKRINPKFSVDQMGNIKWISSIMDYDSDVYYRGKKVTADEYNELFIKQATQANYTADSLQELLNTHLGTAIRRRVAQDFNLVSSFIKIYTSADWGEADEQGYYYISIPVSEHGFQPTETEDVLDRINIEADMYVLNDAGAFTFTQQVEIHPDNTVRVYTDDPSIQGFIAIRANDKAYALSEVIMDATQVVGLAPVAISGSFDDLAESEVIRQQIQQNTDNILDLASGEIKVGSAEQADYANALTPNSTIQNIRVSDIFETGSRYVKNATTTKNYENTGGIAAKFTDVESQINNVSSVVETNANAVAQDIKQIDEQIVPLSDFLKYTWPGFMQGLTTDSLKPHGEYNSQLCAITLGNFEIMFGRILAFPGRVGDFTLGKGYKYPPIVTITPIGTYMTGASAYLTAVTENRIEYFSPVGATGMYVVIIGELNK